MKWGQTTESSRRFSESWRTKWSGPIAFPVDRRTLVRNWERFPAPEQYGGNAQIAAIPSRRGDSVKSIPSRRSPPNSATLCRTLSGERMITGGQSNFRNRLRATRLGICAPWPAGKIFRFKGFGGRYGWDIRQRFNGCRGDGSRISRLCIHAGAFCPSGICRRAEHRTGTRGLGLCPRCRGVYLGLSTSDHRGDR